MIVSLADMKDYLGIDALNTDYDDFLTEQILVTQSAMENYCGRKFESTSYTQEFYRDEIEADSVSSLFLYHYPVISIDSVEDEDANVIADYRLNKAKGKMLATSNETKSKWFQGYNKVEVTFTAGYATIPADLTTVVYSIVGAAYNKKSNGIDVGFGNDVQRISIAGVMSLDFDYSLQANERSTAFGMILGNWVNVLDFYRSERSTFGEIWENYVS